MASVSINDRPYVGHWFDLWRSDKSSMEQTIRRNICADIMSGFPADGETVRHQLDYLDKFIAEKDDVLDMFKGMSEAQVDNWCFYDMLKRGVVE